MGLPWPAPGEPGLLVLLREGLGLMGVGERLAWPAEPVCEESEMPGREAPDAAGRMAADDESQRSGGGAGGKLQQAGIGTGLLAYWHWHWPAHPPAQHSPDMASSHSTGGPPPL